MPRRKLTTRERVRKFRKKDPFMSSIEMGKRLGLSSRGIRRIIASEDELINNFKSLGFRDLKYSERSIEPWKIINGIRLFNML